MTMRTLRVSLWICLCALSGPADCRAAETVRVLLLQNVPAVTVSSDSDVTVSDRSGGDRRVSRTIVVTRSGGTLSANGEPIGQGRAQFRASGQALTVAAGGRDAGEAAVSYVVSGGLHVVAREQGLAVINEVELEDYVKGVVPSEMNSSWHPEALKAQAIVARTYALYQRLRPRDPDYHVTATTQDQVYRGLSGQDQRVQQAVEATGGLIVAYEGQPILAAFSSTAAGSTEDAMNVWAKDLPYLKGVECPFDSTSPYYQWRAEFRLQDLEEALRRQGTPVGTIAVVTPSGYSQAGRVTRLRVLHSAGELFVRGEELRRLIGYSVIPSTQFEVASLGPTMVLIGRGAGHAVGLCQWGAKEMAGQGYPYSTILRYYFPGTELRDVRSSPLPSVLHP
jgi:stage II sporulation protein D